MVGRCSPLAPRVFFGVDVADELFLAMDFHAIEQHGCVSIDVEWNSLFCFNFDAVVFLLEGRCLHLVSEGFGAHANVRIHYKTKLGPQNKSATNDLTRVLFYTVSVGLSVEAEGPEVIKGDVRYW